MTAYITSHIQLIIDNLQNIKEVFLGFCIMGVWFGALFKISR